MSEGHQTPQKLLAMLPSACECGGQDYRYTVGKTVTIAVDDDQPYVSGASEGISNVECMACDRQIVLIEDINDDTELIDQMIEA